MKKKIGRLFFSLLLGLGLMSLAYYRMEGFSSDYLVTSVSKWEKNVSHLPEEQIAKILSQPFAYLGSGRQCFAFVSQDGKWVIKFINQNRFSLPSWLLNLPLPSSLKKIRNLRQARKEARKKAFYESFLLGFKHIPDETGLVYIHFQVEDGLNAIIIKDPIGYIKQVPLQNTHFVLQKKVDLIYPYLQKIRKSPKEFWKAVESYLQLVSNRIQKGLCDDDLNIDQNVGFLEGKAILLDPGRLYFSEKVKTSPELQEEMRRSTKFFRKWMEKNYPEDLVQWDEEVRKQTGKLLPS